MDKVRVRPLRPREHQKLHRLKRQRANQVNSPHAPIVLLSRGGLRNRAIARLVDCSPQWVRTIIHRFNADGLDSISWYLFFQRRDIPRRFQHVVRAQIAEVALSWPKVLLGMNQWSLPKLRDYLVEQKVVPRISVEWLRQLLQRWRIRLCRTKTWKDSTDPLFGPKVQALRRLYARRPRHGRRLAVEEFGPLNLQPRPGHCWTCKG